MGMSTSEKLDDLMYLVSAGETDLIFRNAVEDIISRIEDLHTIAVKKRYHREG